MNSGFPRLNCEDDKRSFNASTPFGFLYNETHIHKYSGGAFKNYNDVPESMSNIVITIEFYFISYF
jgi:hypothetical protein